MRWLRWDGFAARAAKFSRDQRRAASVAAGAHALHDGYTDLIYIMLPLWQVEFGLSYAALGALRDGDRLNAIARWSDVARSHPLSWPALVARTRLAEAGAPVPPVIETTEPIVQPESQDVAFLPCVTSRLPRPSPSHIDYIAA